MQLRVPKMALGDEDGHQPTLSFLVYGQAEDDRLDTYSMRLERGGKLVLHLAVGLYQRLGLEGESATRAGDGQPYKVSVDLCELQPGRPKRARFLQQATMVWGQETRLPWTFTCSQMAWSRLKPLLTDWGQDMTLACAEWTLKTVTVPAPPPLTAIRHETQLPPLEEIEDVGLWLGVIVCNGLLLSDKKLDPFISTCSWPSASSEKRPHQVYTITIPSGIVPLGRICELLESLASSRSNGESFYVAGSDGLGSRSFLMQVEPSCGSFIFCSI